MYQRTLTQVLSFHGIGLHSGKHSTIKLIPATSDTGIVFRSLDGDLCKCGYESVQEALLCTQISSQNGWKLKTIEHLMAALWGCGITDCIVEVDSSEIPFMDGSSRDFTERMLPHTCKHQNNAKAKCIKVVKPVILEDIQKQSRACLLPNDKESLTLSIQVDNFQGRLPVTETFSYSHDFRFPKDSASTFLKCIAGARSFGFESDVEQLRANGLARGGSLDNCVVFRGDGTDAVLNPGGLRYSNEWVRHKLLDAFGDLSLCLKGGGFLQASFESTRPGHATTNRLLHKLFEDPKNYTIVDG